MADYLSRFLGASAEIPTFDWGQIRVEATSLTDAIDGDLVVTVGAPAVAERPLVRIHSQCLFSEVFGSRLCDCAAQLRSALSHMQSGGGLLFYLRMDGRGVGLAAKVAATRLEVAGVDTVDSRVSIGVEPEGRSFAAVGRFLADHGISKVRLLTNNPKKISDIQSAGVDVFRVPLVVPDMTVEAQAIHETKVKRLGHFTSD